MFTWKTAVKLERERISWISCRLCTSDDFHLLSWSFHSSTVWFIFLHPQATSVLVSGLYYVSVFLLLSEVSCHDYILKEHWQQKPFSVLLHYCTDTGCTVIFVCILCVFSCDDCLNPIYCWLCDRNGICSLKYITPTLPKVFRRSSWT